MYGDSLKSCTVAIVVPQETKVKEWADANGKTVDEAYTNADFMKIVLDELTLVGTKNKLSGLEKPKALFLTAEAFSVENNILTPTFKLKRNVAREYFKPQIDQMYEKLAAIEKR